MDEIVIPCAFRIIRPPDGRDVLDKPFLLNAIEVVNEIWSQANIALNFIHIETIDDGFYKDMLEFISRKVANPDNVEGATIVGYSTYWNFPFGYKNPNGFSISSTKAFAVKTYPRLRQVQFTTNFTTYNLVARVTAHEIGHILGLVGDGVWADYKEPCSRRDELMFSGTRGTKLLPEQIERARDIAMSLLQ